MDDTLEDIPQMFGWGDGYEAVIENGLEHIWRAKQKQKVCNKIKMIQESEKEKVVIAQANMIIFSEEGNCETFEEKNIILDNIIRIRHVACMNRMILSDFPFKQLNDRDHTFDDIVNIYAIVDTAEGVCLLQLNLDFAKQTMKLGPFVMIGIPNSSSRIIALRNDQNLDSNQLADDIAHQALKGSEQVKVEQIANVKDYELLIALKGKTINDEDKQQQRNIQQVINIPPKWKSKQIQEDRMAFGVAHGISGTGELQLVSVGHKLKEIIQDDWSCSLNTNLFSSQYYAG
ncbi:MAG: hypothetical protein EZS28_035779 [Streblomastix strix]|uniref:Uncharacterized protein n=1 Tax=Streblomastix strix TaxID=222440 RepID=A0A5J4UGQ4_9EUKA|nr:MAG: hypothetical protein EZS28_035779 [Streblomastix strix]